MELFQLKTFNPKNAGGGGGEEGGGGIWTPCGFYKTVFFKYRLKPCYFCDF